MRKSIEPDGTQRNFLTSYTKLTYNPSATPIVFFSLLKAGTRAKATKKNVNINENVNVAKHINEHENVNKDINEDVKKTETQT